MLDLSTVVLVLLPPRTSSRSWSLVAVPRRIAGDGHFGEPRTEEELWEMFHRARSSVEGALDGWVWVVGHDGRTRGRVFERSSGPVHTESTHDPDCDRTRLASVA